MKATTLGLVFAIAFSNCALGQQKVHFQVSYQPQHSYKQSIDQTINMKMNTDGDADAKEGKDGNVISIKMESETKTGKAVDTLFPFKMTVGKIESSMGANPIPKGTAMFGKASTNGAIIYDSLQAEGLSSEEKEQIFPSLKQMANQLNVTEHTLQKGQSFTTETPLQLPMGGAPIEMTVTTTYTLKDVSNGLAYFDLTQTYAMTSESAKLAMTAEGKGTGSIIYDIKNTYYTHYETNTKFNMEIAAGGQSMKMNMETRAVQKVVISN